MPARTGLALESHDKTKHVRRRISAIDPARTPSHREIHLNDAGVDILRHIHVFLQLCRIPVSTELGWDQSAVQPKVETIT